MGMFDGSGFTRTEPFGFNITDPVASKGAMSPLPWGNSVTASPTSRPRSSTRFYTGSSQASTGPAGLPEDVSEGIGRTNVNLFGGLRQPFEEQPDWRTERPDIRAATEAVQGVIGPEWGPVRTIGEALANGVNFLSDLTGAVPMPNWESYAKQQLKDIYARTDDGEFRDEVEGLYNQMTNDPHFAAERFNDFFTQYQFEISRALEIDPLTTPLAKTATSLQDRLFQGLQTIGLPANYVERLYVEHGMPTRWFGEDILGIEGFAEGTVFGAERNLDEEVLSVSKESLPDHIRGIRERYERGEITRDELNSLLVIEGVGYSNDGGHSMLLNMFLDPANLSMGMGLIAGVGAKAGRTGAVAISRLLARELGPDIFEEVVRKTEQEFIKNFTKRGRPPTPAEVKNAGLDAVERARIIQRDYPDIAERAIAELPARQRAMYKMGPTIRHSAMIAKNILDPVDALLNRGAHTDVIAAYSAAQSVEGITFSYGIENTNALRSLFEATGNGEFFSTLLGRAGANIEAALHRETTIRSAITNGAAPPAHYNPNDAFKAMSEAGTSRLAIEAEGLMDRVMTQFLPSGKVGAKAREEVMETVRAVSRARLIKLLGADHADEITRFIKKADEKALAQVEHIYFMDLIEQTAKAKKATLKSIDEELAKAQAKLATVTGKKSVKRWENRIKKLQAQREQATRYTLIGPRELTNRRAKTLLSQIRKKDVTAVRSSLDRFDKVYDNFSGRGLSDTELLQEMELWLVDVIDSGALVSEIDPSKLTAPMRKIINDEKGFSSRLHGGDKDAGYTIGMSPEESQLWRASYNTKGELTAINPWVDHLTESAADWTAGRFSQARVYLLRPIRGQKLLEEARRNFHRIASDAGLSRMEGQALFSAIRGEANRIGVMPRGLSNADLWRVANGVKMDPNVRNALGERGIAAMVAKAFEGQMHTVGVANKLSGKMKMLGRTVPEAGEEAGMGIPLLSGQPGEFISLMAEKFYPSIRFRWNPVFMAQEAAEPFFWNILRGVKPGITWRLEDLETLESMRASGLISEFEDQYEYSTHILLGAQATREMFGTNTKIGRLWGSSIGEGRRVQSLAELKRLNFVRQVGKRHGELLKESLDGIDPTIWNLLRDEVEMNKGRAASMKDIANYYWLNKRLNIQNDPKYQAFLADATKPAGLGRRAPIRVDPLARLHMYNDASSMRMALDKGKFTETEFRERMSDLGADAEYTDRAWFVISSDPPVKFWASYRDAVRDALGVDPRQADAIVAETRKIHVTHAARLGMSEDEFLATRYGGQVQFVTAAGRVPKGAKFQAAMSDGTFYGTTLLPRSDGRILRITEPLEAASTPPERSVVADLPPNHPDRVGATPGKRRELGDDRRGPSHVVGDKDLDDWKTTVANVLGDEATLALKDEATGVPSVLLSLAQRMTDNEVYALAGLPATVGREAAEDAATQRMLRAFAEMMVQEDMDYSSAITALMGMADTLVRVSPGSVAQRSAARTAMAELMDYLPTGEVMSWRTQRALRALVIGDEVMPHPRQMRAFGYVDDIAGDDLMHGLGKAGRTDLTPANIARETGVVPRVTRIASAGDGKVVMDLLDTEVFRSDPVRAMGMFVDDFVRGDGNLSETARASALKVLRIADSEDLTDSAIMRMLANDAEQWAGQGSLWRSRSGTAGRLFHDMPPRELDEAGRQALLNANPDWERGVDIFDDTHHAYASTRYRQWADELNAEEYLGRTDWTAHEVAIIDEGRYSEYTLSGATWDTAAATRRNAAILHVEMRPDTHAAFPNTSETIPEELGGHRLVEDELATWWAPELEETTGITVINKHTARDTNREYILTEDEAYDMGMGFEAGDIIADADEGYRTSMVGLGTPEQAERAVLTTGATFGRREVSAISMELNPAPAVGNRTAAAVGRAPKGWTPTPATDIVVRPGEEYEAAFDALTDMLNDRLGQRDIGRVVFDNGDGTLTIRLIEHDAIPGDTPLSMQMGTDMIRLGEVKDGSVNVFRRESDRGSEGFLEELDARGDTTAADAVRTRYRGAAQAQADISYSEHTPTSYEAKRAAEGDNPPQFRNWKFQANPRGVRGAVAEDASGRAVLHLLRGAGVDTILHETFHVFVKDLEPSMVTHLLTEYAKANGLEVNRVLAKGMTLKAEDWMAEEFVKYVARGVAPDPVSQSAYNAFGKMLEGMKLDDVNPEFASIMDDWTKVTNKRDAVFHPDEHRIFQAARTSMQLAEDEAFTTHYFKRGRSFLERSINHPYLGLYPASYMWGKALPELVRFLVAKPFGVNAPLWGLAQAINVWEGISLQLNTDTDLREMVEGEHAKEFIRFFQMMLPGSPVDIPVQAPAWMRNSIRTIADMKGRQEAGLEVQPPDVIDNLARSGSYSMNPLTWIETMTGVGEEVRQGIANAPDIFLDLQNDPVNVQGVEGMWSNDDLVSLTNGG